MEEILASIRRIIAEDDEAKGEEEETKAENAGEPTMEEILASIRRIIAEGDEAEADEHAASQPVEGPAPTRQRTPGIADPPPAEIPTAQIAAIEPEWVDGLLTTRRIPAVSNLPADLVTSLFTVLRREITDFADALASNRNTDPRFLTYVQRLVSSLPETAPDQVLVFELGHAAGRLEAYAQTFAEETTSAFLIEQYRGVVELLSQVTAQFPAWRDFKRNAFADQLTVNQVDAGFALARELALAMETDEARSFIDPALPNAIRELAPPAQQVPATTGPARDLQAADAVASSGNTLRSLALASAAKSTPMTDALGRGAIKGVEKISEDVVVFTANLAYWGAIGGLLAVFPQFAWIMPLALAASKLGKKS